MTNYSFEVAVPEGLHARPCAKLIEILKPFEPVHITYNENVIKNLSILDLLLQKIPTGSTVTISTSKSLPPETAEKLQSVFSDL